MTLTAPSRIRGSRCVQQLLDLVEVHVDRAFGEREHFRGAERSIAEFVDEAAGGWSRNGHGDASLLTFSGSGYLGIAAAVQPGEHLIDAATRVLDVAVQRHRHVGYYVTSFPPIFLSGRSRRG